MTCDYTLTRSKRKTLALYVRDGTIEVRAPLKMSQSEIDKFIATKEKWIADKLAQSLINMEQRKAFVLDYGDMILYRGKRYPIAAKEGNRIGFDDTVFYMPPNLPPEEIKAVCVQIYRLLARRDLTNKTIDFAKIMDVPPSQVKISGAKTSWGSCSNKKSINFSWRLIMAADDVINYVVVHELAHLIEMNHSERFWAIVEGVLPDYQERQKRLKELQRKLSCEDWE